MIKSVSSWICDESEIQTHISMILSFSTRFMTKRKHSDSTNVKNFSSSRIWIFLLFSIRFMIKRKKNSEFIAFIINTRKKTVQIEFFKEISQKVIKETFSKKFKRLLSLLSLWSEEISIRNEIKWLFSFLLLWSTETRLSSLWSEEIWISRKISFSRKITIALIERNFVLT
jgi:hypothetical protein